MPARSNSLHWEKIAAALGLSVLVYALLRTAKSGQNSASTPRPKNSREDLIDTARMDDLSKSLGASLVEVIDSYFENTPLLLKEMRDANQRGDDEALQRAAHSLKSSSAIFGAKDMVKLCSELEFAASENDLRFAMIEALSVAYKKVQAVLNLYLK
jgi:histidine phosphotransfer protein HptB